MSVATFAVVGHPNKGKSSLVAALAQDASVRVDAAPGTTVKARRFPMRLDGRTLYELVDTPGFQRPRAVLAWLEEHGANAAERPAAVSRFVAAHLGAPRFEAECELLAPIVEGAGILYVVDGAVPYTPEYDAEMEILRWTGRPSIAVINTIGDDAHVADWTLALAQYFRIVRELDVLSAPFEKRLQVLGAFSELAEQWRAPMTDAMAALRADHEHARRAAAEAIAALVDEAVGWKLEQRLPANIDPHAVREQLERRYREGLRKSEAQCRERVESLYRYESVERHESELAVFDEDLFDVGTWLLFGLNRADLAKAGATGGALAGLGVDAAVGGHSLFLGAAVGALTGGLASWFSADALAELEVERLPLGGKLARYGPDRNPNLPYVLIGRARAHHRALAGRSHARREPLELERQGAMNVLEGEQRTALAKALSRLTRAEPGSSRRAEARSHLAEVVHGILRADESSGEET